MGLFDMPALTRHDISEIEGEILNEAALEGGWTPEELAGATRTINRIYKQLDDMFEVKIRVIRKIQNLKEAISDV